ncbi:MAG: carbohydrate kinase [Acidobacteria bacterium]|nr:carbohydrate kinase [Acidobacteriota bacterium]
MATLSRSTMSTAVFLGIDLGTQSVRVMAVTEEGAIAAVATQPLTSTRDGVRHEQDPRSWWQAVATCSRNVMSQLGNTRVKGLAIDATSGTILMMHPYTLEPLTSGLMYDDGRAKEEAALCNEAGGALWSELSYRMQPSWALPKLLWLERHGHIPFGAKLAHQNDFINAQFAGEMIAADSSNSLKTGFDLIRMQWPTDVIEKLELHPMIFPEVVLPGTKIGEVCPYAAEQTGIPIETPIFAGMTDGCAAQIASGATTVGSWNSVVGTTLVMKGVTRELLHDPLGVVYSHRSTDGMWLPGGASSTGAGVITKEFPGADLDALNAAALQQGPTRAVVYPLAGQGERYPFAAPAAQGFTLGEPASTEEKYNATLQGIAFIERLAFDALRHIGAPTDGSFTISGGATKSAALNQIRADVMQRTIGVPEVTEGAFGMAVLAAAHTSSIAEATKRMVRIERTIEPKRSFAEYADQYIALVDELAKRGWLPQDVADFARAGARA